MVALNHTEDTIFICVRVTVQYTNLAVLRRCMTLGTLRKSRPQRQRERLQTIGLNTKTIAMHVRFNSWYISLPSPAKQQREMTKFCAVWRT